MIRIQHFHVFLLLLIRRIYTRKGDWRDTSDSLAYSVLFLSLTNIFLTLEGAFSIFHLREAYWAFDQPLAPYGMIIGGIIGLVLMAALQKLERLNFSQIRSLYVKALKIPKALIFVWVLTSLPMLLVLSAWAMIK